MSESRLGYVTGGVLVTQIGDGSYNGTHRRDLLSAKSRSLGLSPFRPLSTRLSPTLLSRPGPNTEQAHRAGRECRIVRIIQLEYSSCTYALLMCVAKREFLLSLFLIVEDKRARSATRTQPPCVTIVLIIRNLIVCTLAAIE